MRIYIHDTENDKYYVAYPSIGQVKKYNNYALISCGWSMPEELPRRSFTRMKHEEVTKEEWNHSGCQSSCTLRGAIECRW